MPNLRSRNKALRHEAVQAVANSDLPISVLAPQMGIHHANLRQWCRQIMDSETYESVARRGHPLRGPRKERPNRQQAPSVLKKALRRQAVLAVKNSSKHIKAVAEDLQLPYFSLVAWCRKDLGPRVYKSVIKRGHALRGPQKNKVQEQAPKLLVPVPKKMEAAITVLLSNDGKLKSISAPSGLAIEVYQQQGK